MAGNQAAKAVTRPWPVALQARPAARCPVHARGAGVASMKLCVTRQGPFCAGCSVAAVGVRCVVRWNAWLIPLTSWPLAAKETVRCSSLARREARFRARRSAPPRPQALLHRLVSTGRYGTQRCAQGRCYSAASRALRVAGNCLWRGSAAHALAVDSPAAASRLQRCLDVIHPCLRLLHARREAVRLLLGGGRCVSADFPATVRQLEATVRAQSHAPRSQAQAHHADQPRLI